MPVNFNHFIVYDFETTGVDIETAEIIQVGAIVINPRTLEIVKTPTGDDMVFNSLLKIPDSILADIEKDPALKNKMIEALKINKKSLDDIQNAPDQKVVWEEFHAFVRQFNKSPKNPWTAPIPVGYNIDGYDNKLAGKMNARYNIKTPLWHPVQSVDLIKTIFTWTENSTEPDKLKLDVVREYMGLTLENAHDALADCYTCAKIFQKFQRRYRQLATKIKLKNCFVERLNENP